MADYIKLISCFDSVNRYYWIDALVNNGSITPAMAGVLIVYFNQ